VTVQAQVPLAFGAQVGPAVVPSEHIVVTLAGAGAGHFSVGQAEGVIGTHAQTDGELSNLWVDVQRTVSTQEQMPPQSAPPWAGSQLSLGSSTHFPPPGHALPAMPPHETAFDTHLPASQCVPAAHFTVAHRSVGGGLHLQVGQPLASSTLPYSQ